MARYIDADKLSEMIQAKADTLIEGKEAFLYVAKWLELLHTADVVPKSEWEKLQAKIDELKKDRYQILPDGRIELIPRTDVDKTKSDLAREIFEEIYEDCFDQFGYINYEALAELKKKYTEGKDEDKN
ncbi:MAG: hypothetical protein IKB47_00810 [Clostridia bacterium]|nr:hypothetical protein [Clostridia bacterium]